MGYTRGSVQQQGKRFYVQLYWKGKIEKFWSVLIQGQWYPIKNEGNAYKLLYAIREDIDRDREAFDPRSFRPSNPLCIGEYYTTWLSQIDVTIKTKRDYKTYIKKYAIPFFGTDKDIRKFRKAELTAFQKSLNVADKTRYNIMGGLKAMIRWAYSNEEIKNVPPFPKMSMGESPEIEYLTLEQQDKIIAFIPEQNRDIFQFAMEYGLRVGEVRALKRDALVGNKVYIKRAFSDNNLRETTKTGEIRSYDLTPTAQDIIQNIDHLRPFIFVRKDGKPYTNKNLNETWREACEKANIKIKLYNAIRHSLGCQLLDEGHDMSLVQEILGHKNASMTRRYAKRTPKKIGQVLSMRRCGRPAVEIEVNKVSNYK